jgi:hypothetical protein
MVPRKPLELPERWRHYSDERGLHIEACDKEGATKAVLRVREVGINRQQLVINAQHLKETTYSEKAANLLRLAAERLVAETGRPNAVVTIGKESWMEKKEEKEKKETPRLNAEQEANMHELLDDLRRLKPPSQRMLSKRDLNRTVEDERPEKWVAKRGDDKPLRKKLGGV